MHPLFLLIGNKTYYGTSKPKQRRQFCHRNTNQPLNCNVYSIIFKLLIKKILCMETTQENSACGTICNELLLICMLLWIKNATGCINKTMKSPLIFSLYRKSYANIQISL